VLLRAGMLHCELDFNRTYVLIEAYKFDLHVEFANAKTDQQLIAFVRRWGPPFLNPKSLGVMDLNFDKFRDAQRRFNAVLGVLHAFKEAEGEREALLAFIAADHKVFEDGLEELALYWRLKDGFPIDGSIAAWVGSADLPTVRAAMDFLIPQLVHGPNPELVCRRSRERNRLEADWNIYDLEAALEWMVWYDEFTQNPLVCCKDCRKVFRGESARPRTYCTEECGHRATARDAMRKRRGWTLEQIRAGKR
jgi:hypothetical protein